jgi:hypothetical protein
MRTVTSETALEDAFNVYLKLAGTELRPQPFKPSSLRPFELHKNRFAELRHLVDEIETSSEFGELVKQTLLAFPPEYATEPDSSLTDRANELGHFFRRSGCYTTLYTGKGQDGGVVTCLNLLTEFRKEQIQVRRLVRLKDLDVTHNRSDASASNPTPTELSFADPETVVTSRVRF